MQSAPPLIHMSHSPHSPIYKHSHLTGRGQNQKVFPAFLSNCGALEGVAVAVDVARLRQIGMEEEAAAADHTSNDYFWHRRWLQLSV
ncbi:hypothetical protein CCP3SC15_6000002 [Gammaproteobacteria bacterium]